MIIVFQSYLGMSSIPSKVGTALKISYHLFFESARTLEVYENQNLGTCEKQMRKIQNYPKNFMNKGFGLAYNQVLHQLV